MPKISQLTELTTLQTGSIIPVVDGLVTKKVTMGTLVTFLNVETGVIPSGTVSSSTQLNSLGAVTTSSFNSYTSSLVTTGSNIFNGNQTISGSLTVSGSANLSGSIVMNELTYPTAYFGDGQYGVEVPTLGVDNVFNMEIPKTIYVYVKNDSGGTLPKGTPVHSTGAAGFNTLVIAASASNAATMPATYILAQDLDDDEEGLGIVTGAILGINTTGLTSGKSVYVGANGGFTQTKPTGSNLIQNLGIVTKVGNNGGGVVLGAGRSNDVPNIQEGYFWVGNSSFVATPTPTSSFATTGSNTFIGNQIIIGSVYVTGSNSTIVLPNNSTAPTSPASGALYFNTTDFHFYGWNGGQWKQLDN